MFIFPNTFILRVRHSQNKFNIGRFLPDQLLNVLLYSQCAVHFLKGFIRPSTEILYFTTKTLFKYTTLVVIIVLRYKLAFAFVPGRFLRSIVAPSAIFIFDCCQLALNCFFNVKRIIFREVVYQRTLRC